MREKQTGTLCKKICLSVFFPVILVHTAVWAETTYSDPRAVLGSGQQPAPVEGSGEALLQMAGRLTVAQINEITIDLLRELETGQDQISYLIPSYVGKLICLLPQKERSRPRSS